MTRLNRMTLAVLGLVLLGVVGRTVSRGGAVAPAPRTPEAFAALLAEVRGLPANSPALADLRSRLDYAAGQRDASLSGLYWYTDLDEAKAAARAQGKPILSLRLLGRLDEEFSCANSRFFRAVLYADPEISRLLSEHYILHWQSLRPVPVITVDFGNGQVLRRTITGNSIHYVLSPDGQVIDALPGLIAPRLFERELKAIVESRLAPSFDRVAIASHVTQVLTTTPAITAEDFALPEATQARLRESIGRRVAGPRAVDAARLALSKAVIERPLLAAVRNPMPALDQDSQMNLTQFRPQIMQWLSADPLVEVEKLNERVYRELFETPLDDPMMGLEAPDVFSGLPTPMNE